MPAMLILSRKPYQTIFVDRKPVQYLGKGKVKIGPDTHHMEPGDWVTIQPGVRMKYMGGYKARANQVRFAFDAPMDVEIVRDDAKKVKRNEH
jgi:sRNA-binding carbon storage regulator CsrA